MSRKLDKEVWDAREAAVAGGLAQNPPWSNEKIAAEYPDLFPPPHGASIVANTISKFPQLRRRSGYGPQRHRR